MATLHISLDEAGNLDFRSSESRYSVFATAWTYEPGSLAQRLTQLRFSLLKASHDLDGFHAAEDQQVNRDAVVQLMVNDPHWRWAGLVVEKAKVNPAICEAREYLRRCS